jgi:biopolymer transport protein ExbD
MKNIEWTVLDDLKMNLIAALITLLFAATFTKTIQLPFQLQTTPAPEEAGRTWIKSETIQIYTANGQTYIELGNKKAPLSQPGPIIENINPDQPINIATPSESKVTLNQLIRLIAELKKKGANNVNLLTKKIQVSK